MRIGGPFRAARRVALALTLVLTLALLPDLTRGGVADFENFNEGDFFFPSFVDPASGITFINSTGPDPGEWVIEFTGPLPGMPTISPGNYLVSVGHSPGPGGSLPYQFGFTGILPTLADRVSMSVAYSTNPGASLTFEGFNAAGARVALTTVTPPSGNFIELRLQLESPSIDIRSIKVTPVNMFTGYDNIEFVPEPGALLPWLGAILLSMRGRRSAGATRTTSPVQCGSHG